MSDDLNFSLFSAMELDDTDSQRTARKAVALATRRAEVTFGDFLRHDASRFALIEEEFDALIKQACEELGHLDVERVAKAVKKSVETGAGEMSREELSGPNFMGAQPPLGQQPSDGPVCPHCGQPLPESAVGHGPDGQVLQPAPGGGPDGDQLDESQYYRGSVQCPRCKQGFTREARRPKMCPYHREVVDISLASADPTAGFNAMSQHAWSQNHCQGEGYEGRCNFKPAMVTQTYWDEKQQQADERRQQRELEQAQQPQPIVDNQLPIEQTETPDQFVDETDDYGAEAPEPSAVGMGEAGRDMALASRQADTLKTVDLEQGGEGPSPKMDKRQWKPNALYPDGNLSPVDTEMEGTAHPTEQVDITEGANYRGDDFLEGTKAQTEQQDVTKERQFEKGKGGTFPKGNQADPVGGKQSSVKEAMPSAFTRQDFELIASTIARSQIDPGAKQQMAQDFAQQLAATNPLFNEQRFMAAALGEGAEQTLDVGEAPAPQAEFEPSSARGADGDMITTQGSKSDFDPSDHFGHPDEDEVNPKLKKKDEKDDVIEYLEEDGKKKKATSMPPAPGMGGSAPVSPATPQTPQQTLCPHGQDPASCALCAQQAQQPVPGSMGAMSPRPAAIKTAGDVVTPVSPAGFHNGVHFPLAQLEQRGAPGLMLDGEPYDDRYYLFGENPMPQPDQVTVSHPNPLVAAYAAHTIGEGAEPPGFGQWMASKQGPPPIKPQYFPPELQGRFGATDVNKNPIQEILDSDYQGFVPESQVQQAIARKEALRNKTASSL